MIDSQTDRSAALASRALFAFPVPAAEGKEQLLVLPVPDEELLAFLTDKTRALRPPEPVDPWRTRLRWFRAQRPSREEVQTLIDALASMSEMQMQLVDAVARALEITPNLYLQHALAVTLLDLNEGSGLHEAFARFPDIFGTAIVGQLAAAGTAGATGATLRAIAAYMEMLGKLISQLRVAMIYPVGVVTVLYIAVSVILYGVMPKFSEAFASMGAPIKGASALLLEFSMVIQRLPGLLLSGPALAYACWIFRRQLRGPAAVFARYLPVFGGHYLFGQITIATTTLASLLQNGIHVHQAAGLVADSTSDPGAANAFRKAQQGLEVGDSPATAFTAVFLYFGKRSTALQAALRMSDDKASVAKTVAQAAALYQRDFGKRSEAIVKIIEPVMVVMVGGVVATLVYLIFSPIVSAPRSIR